MGSGVLDAVAALQAAADELCKQAENGGFEAFSDEGFVEVAREVEAIRRQLATVDYPIVTEVEVRELPELHLARSSAGVLSRLWRLSPHEASARVREATALGARRTLIGQVLEPLHPRTAGARRSGILSGAQAGLIVRTLEALPDSLAVDEVEAAERTLVDAAHVLHPGELARVARHLLDAVDPDGTPPCEEQLRRRTDLWLAHDRDGMVRIGGVLDPVVGAKAEAWIAAMSKPRPDDATGTDERSPGQRRHDALGELLDLALRAGEHATGAGCPVTVHLLMSAEQFETGTGHAVTSFGQHIHIRQALRLADQACIAWAVHNGKGGILHHGRTRRLATREQTEALFARDGGCAFPGCDHPMEWCERHHVIEWRVGGPTDLDNLVLLCGYHHARFAQQGWRIAMRDKVSWFIPPPLVDPEQKPIRNVRALGVNMTSLRPR